MSLDLKAYRQKNDKLTKRGIKLMKNQVVKWRTGRDSNTSPRLPVYVLRILCALKSIAYVFQNNHRIAQKGIRPTRITTKIRWRKSPKDLPRKRHDTPGTSNAFVGLTAILTILMLVLYFLAASKASALEWEDEPDVYFNQNQHTVDAVSAIEYALWSIRERTGKSGYYAGTTTQSSRGGAIVVRWALDSYFVNLLGGTYDGYAYWMYDSDGYFTESGVSINMEHGITGKQLMWVVLHELGHSFGANIHHSGVRAVFSNTARQYPYDYTLTTADVLQLPDHGRSLCHSELTLENDIYVPDVQGQAVMFRYQGNNVWKLVSMNANPNTQGCTQASIDSQGVITMTDVRGITGNLSLVILSPVGDNTWSLTWAE